MRNKKRYVAIFAALIAVFVCVAVGCGKYSEVEGTYEMSSVSGNIGGIEIDESTYEYFRIILEANGKAKVQSKGTAQGSVAYEATGTFVYENGEIQVTATNGSVSTTEVYQYQDCVITYSVDTPQMKFTITLKKAEQTE